MILAKLLAWRARAGPGTLPHAADDGPQPHFLPQICCHTGRIAGVELAYAGHGPTTLDDAQAEALMRHAAAALRRLADHGYPRLQIALQLPARAMAQHDFADLVLWECDRLNVSPGRLLFEPIPGMRADFDATLLRDTLNRLADAGCGLDLDALSPVQGGLAGITSRAARRLRIAATLCQGSHGAPERSRMILSTLAMADHFGLPTLACGVDHSADYGWLAQIGCDMAEGKAVASPLDPDALLSALAAHRADDSMQGRRAA